MAKQNHEVIDLTGEAEFTAVINTENGYGAVIVMRQIVAGYQAGVRLTEGQLLEALRIIRSKRRHDLR